MKYSVRYPVIHTTPISVLRPTQMTVGMREVKRKLEEWRAEDEKGRAKTLENYMVPIVLGPGGTRYITDHHHLARALWDDGQKDVFVTVIGDLRKADAAKREEVSRGDEKADEGEGEDDANPEEDDGLGSRELGYTAEHIARFFGTSGAVQIVSLPSTFAEEQQNGEP